MLIALVAAWPVTSFGASCEPLVVVNPFVSAEELAKVCHIEVSGQPVVVLNPYVDQPEVGENELFPYRRIVPLQPQMIFPAKLK